MKTVIGIIFGISILIVNNVNSTTWGETEIEDPIIEGAKCKVQQPMSSGSYIYQWPSKYDQVFWPFTVKSGIWYCEKSGFISLIGDFERLSNKDKANIAVYLKSNPANIMNFPGTLIHLEKIYSLRESGKEFQNRLLRVLAYQYESSGEIELANSYRRKALKSIEMSLKDEIPEQQKLEYLFLATTYNKQFGDDDRYSLYLNYLIDSLANLKDKELTGYAEYLERLIQEVEGIELGGVLAPIKVSH